ncbi:MAG: ABC transporter substrate-binding protein [Archaeoglobaceae archaeon]|nr:ABC transporter substrate-binding protein [Archaeoglobaceae archaeon]MDW8128607.1 ABC transporter substrate-binding protein [Archaeoglobaceae archaeon]
MKGVKLLLLALLAIVFLSGCAEERKVEEIKIGVLVDLSGPLTTYGTSIKNTLSIAEEDINQYLKAKDLPYTVKFYVEDTKVEPKITLEKVQSLYAKGINLIVGPMGSGEVRNIKDFVTANKIIIVSPSSTAVPKLLGVTKPEEKKFIFRFVALDDFQTEAIVAELKALGIKAVVITHIGNAWGRGLSEVIATKLEKEGIELKASIEYPEPLPADYSPYIAKIEENVVELMKKYSEKEIAVLAFSYEEASVILAQTKSDSKALSVIWLGCDGTALSGKLLEVCEKSSKVKMLSTLFESKGKGYSELESKYRQRGYGDAPYQYAMNAYDAAWVLVLSYIEVVKEKGKYDPDEMATKIPVVAEKFSKGEYGVETVSGYIKLNEWNDRASGDFAIYYIKDCSWKLAGIWNSVENKITWFESVR